VLSWTSVNTKVTVPVGKAGPRPLPPPLRSRDQTGRQSAGLV
jgi:hypothetical protein